MRHYNIYSKVIGLALAALTLTACSDTWDDHYNGTASGSTSGMSDISLWQAIKQNNNLSNFASVVEACGYDKSLGSSQVFTVFAPTNEHFSAAEANELIQAYNAEKQLVNDEDNMVIKEFLQNHIALFNHSTSASSSDSLVMMNGKYVILSHDKIGNATIASSNQLYGNGVLFTVNDKVEYFPNVFEYLRKDADLDSLSNFMYNSRFYRREFQADKSVAGGFVDGKTVYLDSVFQQQNDLFDSDFLRARLNQEDSVYWMVAPTNEVWKQLLETYQTYFNYDDVVNDRDSLFYTNPRLAIVAGTVFSRSYNTDAALQDSALSTNAITRYSMRASNWGSSSLHYYQFGDGTGYSLQKPWQQGGVFYGTDVKECSNGQVMKASQWNINPLNTFNQWIIVEAEGQGAIKEVSKYLNTAKEEVEDVTPTPRTVSSDNGFFGKVWQNSFVEFVPANAGVNHSVTFNIFNYRENKGCVLSNMGYDIYLVTAPALAYDVNAADAQRVPTKLRCTLSYHEQNGKSKSQILQSSVQTSPDEVDYILLAEDFKFPCSSYGVEEEEPQVTMKVETRVSSTEQNDSKFTRTMRIDCIMLVPHGCSKVEEDRFLVSAHQDGVGYYWLKK